MAKITRKKTQIKKADKSRDYELAPLTPVEHYSYDKDFSKWWPHRWKGAAYICPAKHQIPKEKYDYGTHQGRWGVYCPGCSRWVDRTALVWDPAKRSRTMGRARRITLEDTIPKDNGDEKTNEATKKPDKRRTPKKTKVSKSKKHKVKRKKRKVKRARGKTV